MSALSIKVLLIEDNPGDIFLVERMLLQSTSDYIDRPIFSLITIKFLRDAITTLSQNHFDIVLLDLSLPDSHESDTFSTWQSYNFDIPVIIFTVLDDREMALKSLQQGAQDYLVKENLNAESLIRTIRYAIERQRIIHRLEQQTIKLERVNTQLQQKTTQLELINQEMASFAYSVSHELRNPLTAILGYITLLKKKYPSLEADIFNYLNIIETEGTRINQLINDLMQLSGITQGSMQIQQVNLSDIAEMIVEQLQAAHPERQLSVTITPGLECWGDPILLWVVLENLLSNAWKYTSKKSDALIEFGVIPIPKNLSYSGTDHPPDMESIMAFLPEEIANSDQPIYFVRDNGVGFNMEEAERLFSPFGRLHSNDEFEGSGIGLAIVQRIIHHLEGTIVASAVVNEGATFCFTLSPQVMSSQNTERSAQIRHVD